MSNYHLLEQSKDEYEIRAVFHIAVPDTLNFAGVNYREALVEYLEGPIVSVVPNHDTLFSTENTQLQNGEVYEYVETFRLSDPALTDTGKRDELDARYTFLTTSVLTRLETLLKWWGFDRDVP